VVEQSNEYRFQLDLQVNQAALSKLLPAGWESAAAAQGAAKDCNLRLIFIDRINVLDGSSRVLPPGKDIAVYLEAPVKQTGGAATGRMVLAGISENNTATAATFGTLVKATKVSAARAIATADGKTLVTEDWDLSGAGGEHAQLHIKYVRGPANRAASDVRFLNAANPAQFVTVHGEQETDITRNVTTTPPDRVQEFSFEAGGGKFASLFDGTQKPLSWDSQPTYRRAIIKP
jgi:dipeptidyl aminopeptidase/acylaminoacyl peptidase